MQRLSIRINFLKAFILVVSISFLKTVHGQNNSKISIEAISSVHFNSERHANENGDQNIYSELRIGKPINKYFEIHISAGHQKRSFIYYAQKNSVGFLPLYMERRYIPFCINGRVNLSEFFYEKLHLWKEKGRFDIYYQLGVATLRGKDYLDEREDSFRSQGFYVPYYLVPYVNEYGKVYIINLAGLRYNISPHAGFFLEGGDGALMTLQLGFSARL